MVGAILGSRVSNVLCSYRNDPHLSFLFQGKEDFRPKLTIDELMKSDEVKEYYCHYSLKSDDITPTKKDGNAREGPIRVRKSLSELLCSKSPSFASAVMRSSIRSDYLLFPLSISVTCSVSLSVPSSPLPAPFFSFRPSPLPSLFFSPSFHFSFFSEINTLSFFLYAPFQHFFVKMKPIMLFSVFFPLANYTILIFLSCLISNFYSPSSSISPTSFSTSFFFFSFSSSFFFFFSSFSSSFFFFSSSTNLSKSLPLQLPPPLTLSIPVCPIRFSE